MATGRIYYYPEPTSTLFTIDLNPSTGEYPAEFQRTQETETVTSIRGDGKSYVAFLGGMMSVRVRCDAWVTTEQVRLLRQWENHVKRGGLFGLTLDKDKAWGSHVILPGSVSSVCSAQQWYEPTTSLSNTDEIVFEEASPRYRIDYITSGQTITNATTTFSHGALAYDFTTGATVHVRWRDFFPLLRLKPNAYGQTIIISESDQYFKLDIECMYEMNLAIEIAQAGGVLQSGATAGQGLTTTKIAEEIESIRNPRGRD